MTSRPVLRSADGLAEAGLIAPDAVAGAAEVGRRYAIAVTPAVADLIDPADPADPVARQFVPDPRELTTTPDELADPIGDGAHEVTPGLIHRYPDRVLMKLVGACAVYCRFCFRRETVGDGAAGMRPAEVEAALAYIRAHDGIWEVILSGGDPLVASPRRLAALVADLAAIPHVRVLRVHTRLPVVAPERVTGEMAAALTAPGLASWLAVHANHRRELTDAARAAFGRLAAAGVQLVSQTVLLKGVNDDADTLADLMRGFVEAGVKPYYLHHPDLAPGTAHFRLPLENGRALVAALRARVSGLAMPAYVLDIPGGFGKVPVGPDALVATGDGPALRDRTGRLHRLPS